MKITKPLLREIIEKEVKSILNENQAMGFLSKSSNDLVRARRELEANPEMANIVSNINRAILMIRTIKDMHSEPTDYSQEDAQNLGLLPPKKQ